MTRLREAKCNLFVAESRKIKFNGGCSEPLVGQKRNVVAEKGLGYWVRVWVVMLGIELFKAFDSCGVCAM